jgi:uncharacterized protein YerC
MAKIRVYDVDPEERYKFVGEFLECVLNFRKKKDIIDFFVGLLTPSEMLMISRRIVIARRLIEKATYDEIREELGVGYITIAKTEKWLRRGDRDRQKYIKKVLIDGGKFLETKMVNQGDAYSSNDPLDKYPYHRLTKALLRNIFS